MEKIRLSNFGIFRKWPLISHTGQKYIYTGSADNSVYIYDLMMWALEYDPDLCSVYEDSDAPTEKSDGSKANAKSTRQCDKYERENMKSGGKGAEAALPVSVFLVASVLKDKSSKLLAEARGLDDVVKILNDMTGNLDAKKACTGALKLHKKYLKRGSLMDDVMILPCGHSFGGGGMQHVIRMTLYTF